MKRNLEFTKRVKAILKAVPPGRVVFYGQVAALAGDASQARQVAWILHSSSEKDRLPWHRVISAQGQISLPLARGGTEQRRLLRAEGVRLDRRGAVNLKKYGWSPAAKASPALRRLDVDKLVGGGAGTVPGPSRYRPPAPPDIDDRPRRR